MWDMLQYFQVIRKEVKPSIGKYIEYKSHNQIVMRIEKTSNHAARFILPIVGVICLLLGGCSKDEPESPEPDMFPAYKYRAGVEMEGMYDMRFSYSFPGLFVYGNDIPVPASMFTDCYKIQIYEKYSFVEEAGLKIVGKEETSYDLPKVGESKLIGEEFLRLERRDSHTLEVITRFMFGRRVEEEGIKYIRIGMKDAFPIMINSKEGDFMFKDIDEFDGDTNIGFRFYPGSITDFGHNFIYQPCLIYDNR